MVFFVVVIFQLTQSEIQILANGVREIFEDKKGFSYPRILGITPISLPNKILLLPDTKFLRSAQDGSMSIRVSPLCPLLYNAKQTTPKSILRFISLGIWLYNKIDK